jgi:flagellar hook-basal body complex protein FliE
MPRAFTLVVFAFGSVSSLVTPPCRRIPLSLPTSPSWSSMTLHLLPQSNTKSKATVAELEAESDVLRVEIEQMRAEALRRLQNLQQMLENEMMTTLDDAPTSTTTTTRTKLNKYLDSSTDDINDTSSVTKRGMEQLILDGNSFSTKMGWQDGLTDPLVGTQWKVSLSIGREPSTWMPTEWGKSGKRINVSFVIEFAESKSYDRDITSSEWYCNTWSVCVKG